LCHGDGAAAGVSLAVGIPTTYLEKRSQSAVGPINEPVMSDHLTAHSALALTT
jgi:hypothetical protein